MKIASCELTKYLNNKNIKTLMGRSCNTYRITKYIQNFGHNTWRVSITCQTDKMA